MNKPKAKVVKKKATKKDGNMINKYLTEDLDNLDDIMALMASPQTQKPKVKRKPVESKTKQKSEEPEATPKFAEPKVKQKSAEPQEPDENEAPAKKPRKVRSKEEIQQEKVTVL